MKRIGVITTSRADFGSYVPLLEAFAKQSDFDARLFVYGSHVPRDARWKIAGRIPFGVQSDSPSAVANAMGEAAIAFSHAYHKWRPDLLVAFGDRFEMHAAVTAAVPFRIPVAHLHGGEITEGAMDDALRHSITKLSHLHFPATEAYRDRIVQMGEEPWRVVVSGALAVDAIARAAAHASPEFAGHLLVTFHPETLALERTEFQIGELLAAIDSSDLPVLFTGSNADPAGAVIMTRIREYCALHANATLIENLGSERYFSAMCSCACMVGNSSSGVIEAPSFRVPVVNIGERQAGRIRAANVIDCADDRASIGAAIAKGISPDFRESLRGVVNPYGAGHAAEIIVGTLAATPIDDRLIRKRFNKL
jgi:UDP-hydrolysing UDP-N-acetyl-D-glucosamine 2-epimerase